MNLHPSSPSGGMHRTARMLSLVLLQHVLAPGHVDAGAQSRLPTNLDSDPIAAAPSSPYLKIVSAQPLRFAAAPRPVTLASKPAAIAAQPTPPANMTSVAEPANAPAETVAKLTESPSTVQTVEATRTTPASSHHPANLLPDDTHPSTRPEDFLPFFQFPGGNGVTVVVPATVAAPPAPGQLPASSATYQQK